MAAGEVQAFVFRTGDEDLYRVDRTLRSLRAVGIQAREVGDVTPRTFCKIVGAERPLLFVRAGLWLASSHCSPPRSSAGGKPLCAFGVVRSAPKNDSISDARAARWTGMLRQSGGDFSRLANSHLSLRPCFESPDVLFLDARASIALRDAGVCSLAESAALACDQFRLVHYPPFDVYDSTALRVLQVVTALQRGGAERVTLDLVTELPAHGCAVQIATLGRGNREHFRVPLGTIELAELSADPDERLRLLERSAVAFGTDVIHCHLVTGSEIRSLSSSGFPVILTLHNTRAGWPPGTSKLERRDAALLVACSAAVEHDAQAAQLPIPIRTIRNGIDVRRFRPTPEGTAAGREWRRRWGFSEEDLVLISVANPRPQKRLDLLPRVLSVVQKLIGPNQSARLVFCGEATPGKQDAEESVRRTTAEVHRLGLEAHVRWAGSVSETADILAAADILVSTSAHEGLSLAQLEALALGCSVVATDVGGAREIAWDNPNFHLVAADTGPDEFGRVVAKVAMERWRSPRRISFPAEAWSSHAMAAQYGRLYRRAIASARQRKSGDGLWLITNNFSTGGAQSSARRLLLGLSAEGESVRAAVIEEDPEFPTPGRRALAEAGLRVLAIVPERSADEMTARLLTAIDNDRPGAVVLWNLRPEIKLLLAESLLDIPVFDVSPGEMYFKSLERCLSKCPAGRSARTPRDYGARLSGVIVKYHAEAARAERVLGQTAHVVPNGVSLPPPVAKLSRAVSHVVFGTAARIHPQKRLEDLLAAFRLVHQALPESVLRIAGGVEYGCETYADALKAAANSLPVLWEGEISDISAFHQRLDIFVMISDPAGCPNASLEAMAAGLPVIATDVGGASEQVIDGVTGRVVRSRDAFALSQAMLSLARHPELWPMQGYAGRARVEACFSLKRMIADYRRILGV